MHGLHGPQLDPQGGGLEGRPPHPAATQGPAALPDTNDATLPHIRQLHRFLPSLLALTVGFAAKGSISERLGIETMTIASIGGVCASLGTTQTDVNILGRGPMLEGDAQAIGCPADAENLVLSGREFPQRTAPKVKLGTSSLSWTTVRASSILPRRIHLAGFPVIILSLSSMSASWRGTA